MWVKICANTSLPDALNAVQLGVDAVGFVFAPSRRQVSASQVQAITSGLPPQVERVGVFAGRDPERDPERVLDAIVNTVRLANLTTVQLHGGVDLDFAGRLRDRLGPAASILHVAHWEIDAGNRAADEVGKQLLALEASHLDERILIDAKLGATSGGLGVSFDWTRASRLLEGFPHLKIIVAGGLRPDNVADAVRTLRPYGVDVASGVERSPGHKDPQKLAAFIENARRA